MSNSLHSGSSSEFASRGSWPGILSQLFSGSHLDAATAKLVMEEVLAGRATSAQLASFLTLLRTHGETVEELTGLTQALLDAALPVTAIDPTVHERMLDTCGTGGDRSGTINVSTMAALVAAAAGAVVAKHGNRASSSQTGSADVLEALGVAIDLDPLGVAACINETNLGFFLAPRFHPGFKFVGPVRRELGVSTAFNFMGPLINPARVTRQVIGVSDPSVADLMLGVLQANGTTRAMVVFGHDGLDELTTTTTSTIAELVDGKIHRYDINPIDFGLRVSAPEDLVGGDPALNAERVTAILGGESHSQSDIVALNAAAALVVGDVVETLKEGVDLAQETLHRGAALDQLHRLVTVSQQQERPRD